MKAGKITKYLHIDNGGIFVTVEKDPSETYALSIETGYCGYPYNISTIAGLDINHLKFIKQFFIDLELE